MRKTVVIDYGMGNIHSVRSAFEYLGSKVLVTSDPKIISNADLILLPGVGSFRIAMDKLNSSGISDALYEAILHRKKKILGICLGMQLMAERGEEDGLRDGLGFIKGAVTRIKPTAKIKVPHVGFNSVNFDPKCKLIAGLNPEVDAYFVHSYKLEPGEQRGLLGVCKYGDCFVAAYENENVFATQFHPEKSQTNGLKMLSNFIAA